VLIRYGGEEFLVVLPAAAGHDVTRIGERIRRMIGETQIRHGDQEIKVTVSAGVTSFPETDAKAEDDLLKRADDALYQAKEQGRDRVVMLV
jgi:diguanylate cyclase (GGDEF)-like protein